MRDSTEQQGTRNLNGTGDPADLRWAGEDGLVTLRL